ncbi:unnamed protein product [Acanthoscelides obtectus]|uniref:Uncharacterized protein n=1 Tax=Acanthoscelides obtectus TaxID=200917 RepID=A0A9P0PNM5_ACAOB|nr:unnamed protein product [Acanthoscelides obtectus]CAK1684007.1 hypothetical protein AOBTE_LOCUS34580 [Acanthoscelides obtectus]
MCDISANRKLVLVVVPLTFFGVVLGQVNYPQFVPNPDRNYPGISSTARPFDRNNDNVPYDRNNVPFDRNNVPVDRNNVPYDRNNVPYDRNNVPYDRTNTPYYNVDQPQRPYDGGRRFQDDGRGFQGRPEDDFNRRNRVNSDIRGLLQALDLQASQQCTSNVAAQWNFETNVNQGSQLEAVSLRYIYTRCRKNV